MLMDIITIKHHTLKNPESSENQAALKFGVNSWSQQEVRAALFSQGTTPWSLVAPDTYTDWKQSLIPIAEVCGQTEMARVFIR